MAHPDNARHLRALGYDDDEVRTIQALEDEQNDLIDSGDRSPAATDRILAINDELAAMAEALAERLTPDTTPSAPLPPPVYGDHTRAGMDLIPYGYTVHPDASITASLPSGDPRRPIVLERLEDGPLYVALAELALASHAYAKRPTDDTACDVRAAENVVQALLRGSEVRAGDHVSFRQLIAAKDLPCRAYHRQLARKMEERWPKRKARLRALAEMVGREVDTTKRLSEAECRALLKRFNLAPDAADVRAALADRGSAQSAAVAA